MFFSVDQSDRLIIYRASKSGFNPRILEAKKLRYDPGATQIETTIEGIKEMAKKYTVEIFDLPDRLVILYPGLIWYAMKNKKG